MQLHLIAVGKRMPAWVRQGYEEFARRMPPESRLRLVEIAPARRTRNSDLKRLLEQEGQRMLAVVPSSATVVALDVAGQSWSTAQLARRLADWQGQGGDVALLVGGPEGLAPACRDRAQIHWSLSALTFPHPLVRIIVAEQLYRATTILKGHPYHK